MIGRLLCHVRNYGSANVLATLAGFVSFPVLTRILTVADYGVMSLISSTLALLAIAGKLGVQQSIMRFHSTVSCGQQDASVAQFHATALMGMAGAAVLVAGLWAGVSQVVPQQWWNDPRVAGLMLLTAVLVPVRVVDSALMNILRAEQRSGTWSIAVVLKRYSQLALVLGCVVLLWPGLTGFYIGAITAEVLAVVVLLAVVLRSVRVTFGDFSLPLYKAMLGFGLPMIAYEVGGNVLSFGDRYVIQALLGAEALGGYSAAYNVCEYVQTIVIISVTQALVPVYTRMWDEQGAEHTAAFLQQALHLYIVVGAGVIAAMAILGPQALVILASSKYSHGADVIPWVMAGLVLDGATAILGAGLFVTKQTRTIMWGVVVSAVVNIVLNLVLVPWIGLVGAAVATLFSYGMLCMFAAIGSRKYLPMTMPFGHIAKFGVLATLVCLGIQRLDVGAGIEQVLLQLGCGTLAYVALALVFDRPCRELVQGLWQRRMLRPPARSGSSGQGAAS
jgi:O-antigen/teichoic acid export membrane protein